MCQDCTGNCAAPISVPSPVPSLWSAGESVLALLGVHSVKASGRFSGRVTLNLKQLVTTCIFHLVIWD